MKKRLKKLIKTSSYQSLNTIEISANNITHNFHTLQSLQPDHTIIPILKSNAYGHGIQQICKILQKIPTDSCPLIAVDSYPEYQIVRDTTTRDILILGEQLPSNYHLYDSSRTHFAIGSMVNLQALIDTGKHRNIHLFLNTGMNREGFQEEEVKQLGDTLSLPKAKNITITGIMSHFANADYMDSSYNQIQINKFKSTYHTLKQSLSLIAYNFDPKYIHINNSAGIIKNTDPLFTASRSGLTLYGYNPLEPDDPYYPDYRDLRPALRLTSTIISIQHLQSNDSVSYGHTWTASEPTVIAIIPFGYHEGLPRSLSNTGYTIKHKGSDYPLIGTICMNISTIQGSEDIQLFDTVELISPEPYSPNSLYSMNQHIPHITYEILVKLDPKIKRKIIKKDHLHNS